jgi:5-methylcytosine-specific restriction endonuclease McrA
MTEKYCKKCDNWKLFSEFYKNKGAKDGYCSGCKECQKIYYEKNRETRLEYQKRRYLEKRDSLLSRQREYYENNREYFSEYNQIYREEHKEYFKEYSSSYRKENPDYFREHSKKFRLENPNYLKEYYKDNIEYYKEYFEEYRKNNSDYLQEYYQQYYKNNSEKCRAKDAKRRALKKSSCTNKPEELLEIALFYADCPQGYHVDHIIPLARGGRHELSNLQHLEALINLKKSDKHPDDWDDPRPISCRA